MSTSSTTTTPDPVTDLGWAAPTEAAKARHYFRADERSLCRRYGLHVIYVEEPVLGSVPRECTTCRTQLDKQGVR